MLGAASRRTVRPGDTIVEVLFAVTIFSLIAVAAISLMNRGLALSQQALEITAVRQEIDSQAEALRFLHDSYVDAFVPGVTPAASTPAGRYSAIVTSHTVENASTFGNAAACQIPTGSKFIVNPYTSALETNATKFQLADTYAKIDYQPTDKAVIQRVSGFWTEAVRSTAAQSNGVGFVDFHIRACWDVPGQSMPMTLGTIVRLYDPR